MSTSKSWTMNCVLAGAKAKGLLERGNEKGARETLRNLTSELQPGDVDYLMFRLKVHQEGTEDARTE